jgi:ATP-dependent DNA ligase
LPRLKPSPPTGANWSYEVKLDGFRVQLHKVGLAATLYGKNGGTLTTRFPTIAGAVITLPVRSCVMDGELIAAGAEGQPDFLALLHGLHVPVCVYAFDLLELRANILRVQITRCFLLPCILPWQNRQSVIRLRGFRLSLL